MTHVPLTIREATDAQRVEDAILDLQQREVVNTWTLLDGIALYLSNLADKRQDNPTIENALNLSAAYALHTADRMKQGH